MSSKPAPTDAEQLTIWRFLVKLVKEKTNQVKEEDEEHMIEMFLAKNEMRKKWSPTDLTKYFREEMKSSLHRHNGLNKNEIFLLYKAFQIVMTSETAKELESKFGVENVRNASQFIMKFEKDPNSQLEQSPSSPNTAAPSDAVECSYTDCRCQFHRNETDDTTCTCTTHPTTPIHVAPKKRGAKFTVQEQTAMTQYVMDRLQSGESYGKLKTSGLAFWSEFKMSNYDSKACDREESALVAQWSRILIAKSMLHKVELDVSSIIYMYQSTPVKMSKSIQLKLQAQFEITIEIQNGKVLGWKSMNTDAAEGLVKKEDPIQESE